MVKASLTCVALVASLGAAASAAPFSTMSSPLHRISNGTRSQPVIRSASTQTALAQFLRDVGAHYAGPATFANMTIDVSTPMRNAAGLASYAQAASDPHSLYYRHFLTPGAIGASFGTPAAQYAASAAYFASSGLKVKIWKVRSVITVTGSSVQLGRALGTRFGYYQSRNPFNGRLSSFIAPSTAVTLNGTYGVPNLQRLVTATTVRTDSFIGAPPIPVSLGFSNARVNGATPFELARAFDYSSAYAAGFTGKGVNLGIIGTGPISLEDVPNYRKLFKVPGSSTVSIVAATVNGDSTPPPVTGPCGGGTTGAATGGSSTSPTSTCNPEDEEAQLDTEQTASLAYDANVLFYLAYNGAGCTVASNPAGTGCLGPGSTAQGLGLADDELNQAVNDDQTDILSLSYGGCEILDAALMSPGPNAGGDATGADPTIFQELATEGVATFVSSGDSGSAGCQRLAASGMSDAPNASYPSTDPNVVAVGGTTTPMAPTGQLLGPITNWGSQTKSGGAAGAGQSKLFQTPAYQKNVPAVAAICTMRCQPDVALDADPFTGAAVLFNSGANQGGAMESPIGGTSQAAPDMAAMWALVLSACRVTPSCGSSTFSVVDGPTNPPNGTPASPHTFRLGNPNYLMYPLLNTANASLFQESFYDIVFGDDAVPTAAVQTVGAESGQDAYAAGVAPGSVSAGPGFDEASGLGAPSARGLIRAIVKI